MGRRRAVTKTWGCSGWKCSWHSVLLAAWILSSCFLPSQAFRRFVTIVADPAKPTAGGNVTLIPQGAMNDSVTCRWYRGAAADAHIILIEYGPPYNTRTPGALYSNREKIQRPVCSLHVTNLNHDDSTTFFVTLDKPGSVETGSVNLELVGLSGRGGWSGGLSNGVIAGITVACLLVLLAFGGMLYFQNTNTSH